jgi:Flp pilus assembly protein TadG
VKKLLTYLRNRKGITIIMIALILVVLIMFLGMGTDLAYMYVTKNHLQVAADAAALAGAGELDPLDPTTNQLLARTAAWKFACRNKAATTNVFLIADAATDCNTPPVNLNLANDPNGDIVIGNWDPIRPPATRFLPTSSTPLPLGAAINAVKIVAARTSSPAIANVSNGSNRVKVFVGQVFNWAFLDARAVAIAALPPRASSFVAVGNEFCPVVGDPDCLGGTGSTYPVTCNLVSPRELFAEGPHLAPKAKMGWTSLLYQPGSTSAFGTLMCGTSPYQEICNTAGIWGIPGTSAETFRDYRSLMCDPGFDAGSKEIDPSTGDVTGWEVIIPIVDRTDPMSAPDPNPVWGYARVHIIEICSTGTFGCRGAGSCFSHGYCTGGDKKVVLDRISCIPCGTVALGLKPALVK